IGAWLYLWVVPNQPMKSGMLVCFYHGLAADFDSTEVAFQSPGHVHRGPDGSWVYCYKQDVAELFQQDVDDVSFCGLSIKKIEELKRYLIEFDDGENARFRFDCEYLTRPWDFADNIHPTPRWLAKDRYHRGWMAKGDLAIGGRSYSISTTGDSDHSWGTRDSGIFQENSLKTYALQSEDGELTVKAQMLGPPGKELPRGYIALGRDMQAVKRIDQSSRYHPNGLMHDISLRVEDVAGRVIEASMGELYGAVAGGGPNVGFEGAGLWSVKDWGPCAGLASCWWANGITREQLHKGLAGKTELG
ncbi:MAG: hypothetical protein RLO46_21470, partial [Pseudomonadales bacterium]